MSKRADYIDKLYIKMQKWNKDIDELEGKLRNIKVDVKDVQNEISEKVRPKIKNIEDKISELKNSGDEAWGELSGGIDRAFTELKSAYKNARVKFKY